MRGKIYRYMDNTDRLYIGTTEHDIPYIDPIQLEEGYFSDFIGFKYAKSEIRKKKDLSESVCHFFLDDYQFIRVWRYPDMYINTLLQFGYVCAPDFSIYMDDPYPIQMMNHYRRQWCGAYFQKNGLEVIPSVSWGSERTFDFCFEGIPKNSTLVVGTAGICRNPEHRAMFFKGYEEMLTRLEPYNVILYGSIPKGFEDKFGMDKVIHVEDRAAKFRRGASVVR